MQVRYRVSGCPQTKLETYLAAVPRVAKEVIKLIISSAADHGISFRAFLYRFINPLPLLGLSLSPPLCPLLPPPDDIPDGSADHPEQRKRILAEDG